MSDDVMVQPVRTYLEGSDLVTAESAPYPVSQSRAIELRRNGLVEPAKATAATPVREKPASRCRPA